MISLEKYELLEDLLKGKLEAAIAEELRGEISADPELRDAYESLQLVNKAIEEKEFLEIRKQAEQGYTRYQKRLKSLRLKVALGGAGLLLLASIFLFSQNAKNNKVPAKNNLKEKQDREIKVIEGPHIIREKPGDEIPEKLSSKPTQIKRAQTHISTENEAVEPINEPDTASILSVSPEPKPDTSEMQTVLPEVVQESSHKTIPEDPCTNTEHELLIKSSPACQGEDNGSVQIHTKAGNLSVGYRVLSMEGDEVYGNQLPEGSYLIQASFDDACTKEQKVAVTEKICPKDLLLNRSLEKGIEIPYKKGIFRVTDPAGQVYYEFKLDAFGQNRWDGRSSTGAFKAGFYNFQVIFEGKLMGFGSITLLN